MKKILKFFVGNMVNDQEISNKKKKYLGLVFCILAFICGSIWYYPETKWLGKFAFILAWPFIKEVQFHSRMEFVFPGLLNSLWGLSLTLPIYLRRFIPFRHLSVYSCLSFALNWLLLAVISQLILGKSGTFSHNIMHTILLFSILFSWLGMRSVAGFSWIIVVLLGILNLVKSDIHLQWWGFFFILFTVFSLLFQTEFSPFDFLSEFAKSPKAAAHSQGAENIKESINISSNTISKRISKHKNSRRNT